MTPSELSYHALNRLAKWRTILAGWQLGTRTDTDPEAQAVKDIREGLLVLRAEVNALTTLLVETTQTIHVDEYHATVAKEADLLSESFAERFKGARAVDYGIEVFDPQAFQEATAHFPK